MGSSISSPAAPAPPPAASSPTRDRFALSGRSQPYDPLTTAARRDLADVALADRIFAPHYARALATTAAAATPIRREPALDSPVLATLSAGDPFRVLELTDRLAWGQAGHDGCVGYVDRHALAAA